MKPDAVVGVEGMEALIEQLGIVDAERFIQIVKMDNFDYTKWRENLWEGKSAEDIYKMALEYDKNDHT